jgi:proteasome lid subunit RPN8/RPN11
MLTVPSEPSQAFHASGLPVDPPFANGVVLKEWREYALSQYPREAVAFITAAGLVPVPNVHETPEDFFAIEPRQFVENQGVLAILHSHTYTTQKPKEPMAAGGRGTRLDHLCPSALDMKNQMLTAVPWGISAVTEDHAEPPFWFGDQLGIAPLLGRAFVHGVNDCFSLLRDWHRLHGYEVKNTPRDWACMTPSRITVSTAFTANRSQATCSSAPCGRRSSTMQVYISAAG